MTAKAGNFLYGNIGNYQAASLNSLVQLTERGSLPRQTHIHWRTSFKRQFCRRKTSNVSGLFVGPVCLIRSYTFRPAGSPVTSNENGTKTADKTDKYETSHLDESFKDIDSSAEHEIEDYYYCGGG